MNRKRVEFVEVRWEAKIKASAEARALFCTKPHLNDSKKGLNEMESIQSVFSILFEVSAANDAPRVIFWWQSKTEFIEWKQTTLIKFVLTKDFFILKSYCK